MTVAKAIWEHSRVILFVWLLSLAVNVLMLTGPVYMLQVYRRVLPSNSYETLFVITLLMMLMFTGLWLLDLVRSRILTRISRRVGQLLREKIFDLSTHVMIKHGNMSLARRPQSDIENITNFIGGPAVVAFFDAPFIPVYIFIIWIFHPYLALFAIASAIVLVVLALTNEYRLRKPQEEAVKAHGEAAGLHHELLSAIEAIKVLGMRTNAKKRWLGQHDKYLNAQLKMRDRSLGLSALAKAVRLLMQSLILGLGAWLVLRQEINAGIMIAASIMMGRALYPLEQAITHWHGFRQALAARKRLDAQLEALSRLPPDPRLKPETECTGRLEVRELYAAPPGAAKPVLRNIEFVLNPGKLLLITGENGAGKSTLLRTLAGIWLPLGSGKVLLDGIDLRNWPEEERGRLIGYAPQNVQLVSGTIADNISRLSLDIDEEEIIAAARRIGVHEAIKRMGGINRQVGPAGIHLSAGEQRKVALARAAWGDPIIYILDEPTADLDQDSRKAFYLALLELKKRNRSIVLVDHNIPPRQLVDFHLALDGAGGARLMSLEKPPAKKMSGYNIMIPKA